MPRKDTIHAAVKNALIKDGWTITDDPFRIIAVSETIYDEQFTRRSFAVLIEKKKLALLVVDVIQEEVRRWIK